MDSTVNPKVKTMEGEGIGAHSLACSILGVEGHVGVLGWNSKEWQASQLFMRTYTNQTTKLVSAKLEHFWCTYEPRANMNSQDSPRPGLGGSHHLPPYSILCAWPWDQHSNVILSWDSQVGVPKFPKLGLLRLWGPITLCVDLWLRWGLKKSCNPHQELFNNMWHITCT